MLPLASSEWGTGVTDVNLRLILKIYTRFFGRMTRADGHCTTDDDPIHKLLWFRI